MTPSGQTVCLSMIVKNEAPVIRRCLDSVRPLIDAWLIVDTGSTDGTQEIVRAALTGLPGELVERPWVDFAHNRSEALALARPRADYSLIIDADDTLEIAAGFRLPNLAADSYVLDIHDAGISYQRTQFVRSGLPWRYRGVLHEFLTCEGAGPHGHLPVIMRRNHDGARRRDPQTYRRDATILERALGLETDPFLISRYTFYLAQSYRDCGDRDRALGCYLRRADLGFWQDEVYVALLEAARLMEKLGHPDQAVLETFARATHTCPTRAEALHDASRFCRGRNRFAEGYGLAKQGLTIREPAGSLFVESWIYRYGLLDEVAVNAYWAGLYRDCLSACEDLLSREDLPAEYVSRIAANARFARDRLDEQAAAGTAPAAAPWTPERAQGGTELMSEGLREHLGSALDTIDLCVNGCGTRPRDGRPRVVWIHHNVDQEAVQWLRDGGRVAEVDAFVFVSAWQRTRFLAQFRLPPERCHVLRNATAVDPRNRPWRSGGALRMAYVSTPYRGLSVLLDAWELAWDRLCPHGAELHIWSSHRLYGPDADDTAFEPLYARAASLPRVTHHGIVPNAVLRRSLREIDVLAYPSTFEETSCLAAIEAMAAGCRVICPDLGALSETTGGFARSYPFQADPAAHARVFADILADEAARPWGGDPQRAGAQQDHARRHYDWPVRAAEWQTFIAEIGTGRGGAHVSRQAGNRARPRDRVGEALSNLRDRGFAPTGIIDVGAHDGAFSRTARRVFPDAHILMVDALAEKEQILAHVCGEIGNAAHVVALLGEHENAPTPFFVVDTEARPDLVTTGSSKFRENTGFPMAERCIPQRRLDAVAANRGTAFQLVKLDVQGAEIEVLAGLGAGLAAVDVVLMEMSLVAYNVGAPLVADVLVTMSAMGFVLYDLVEEHRYRDNSLLQIDGLFVREGSPLRARPPFWN